MSERTRALDATVFGVDVQSGDVRGDAPAYALVVYDGESIERDVVSRRKLLRLIDDDTPAIVATDNVYELAADSDQLVHLLRELPDGTRLVQVTGAERPEPLSRVARRHGVPYDKEPMAEAEAAARLAAHSVGQVVTAFGETTEVKVSRGRSTGKGGFSEDRYTRRIHGSVKRRAREVESTLEEAALEFDREVTEKYGGWANAVFAVEARPEEIPVSRERRGDVRVEIKRERRDGIAFEPLARRRDPVIVGMDPGTTTAVAVVGLDGEPLAVHSTRTADRAAVIEWLIEQGRPVLVAADVEPMPETVESVRRSFDAAGWTPDVDLPVDEKLHRTREAAYDNDHERDALAAALFAHDAVADRIDRLAEAVPPDVDLAEVAARVVGGESSVEAAVRDLTPAADEGADDGGEAGPEPAEPSPEQRRIAQLESRVGALSDHVDRLEGELAEREARIDDLEDELEAARNRERQDVRETREVTRLERTVDRLERERDDARERADELDSTVERLKALWRLDHSDFADVADEREGLVPVKVVEQFTTDAIEAADEAIGLAAGDVVYLRDASGAGESTAERLADVDPRLVVRTGGLSEAADRVLFEAAVPVAPADAVEIQEVDDLAVAREADVEAAIADWEARAADRRRERRAEMVDRVISEHRADRDHG